MRRSSTCASWNAVTRAEPPRANPKSETRNPKQIRIPKKKIPNKTAPSLGHWDFGFRISDLVHRRFHERTAARLSRDRPTGGGLGRDGFLPARQQRRLLPLFGERPAGVLPPAGLGGDRAPHGGRPHPRRD